MEIKRNCPYCISAGLTPDVKGHLYINTSKGVAYCHRCNYKGRWEDTLQFPEVWSPKAKDKYADIDIFSFKVSGGENIHDYIVGRLPEKIVLDRVRWSPQIVGRALFPLWSEGKIYAWQGRTIYPNVIPKYLSYGSLSNYLYNIEYVKDWAVLCEGPINALSVPHGVASFGKHLSKEQFFLLTNRFKKVIICFDFGAEKEAKELAKALQQFVEVKILYFEDKRDCNDLGRKEMERRINEL